MVPLSSRRATGTRICIGTMRFVLDQLDFFGFECLGTLVNTV